MNKIKPYSMLNLMFWVSYAVHMRPYLLFVSGIAGLMGASYSSAFDIGTFMLAFLPFFLGYGFGQALTDAFQTDTDTISAPYRPLSKGIITPYQVILVSLIGLFLITLALGYLSWYNLLFCALSIVGLGTYSFVKRHWPFGPFHNSWIVMILPIMGFLSMGGELKILSHSAELWIALLVTFFSYCNFVLIGYLKDIEADAVTGYITFPVKFGWMPTVWMGNLNAVLFLGLSYYLIDSVLSVAGAIFLLACLSTLIGQVKAMKAKEHTPMAAMIPIVNTVRSFILIHMTLMLNWQPALIYFCIVFYAMFELVLFLRPERTQI